MKMASTIILFIFIFTSTSLMATDYSDPQDEIDCAGVNHPAYQDEYRACLRLKITARAKAAGVDCIDCLFEQKNEEGSTAVALASALAQPLAMVLGTYVSSRFQYQAQKAWANAYESGYKECTNRFQSYLDYNTSVGGNSITSSEATTLNNSCNGNSYGSYAGYGGYTSNGYSGYGNPFSASGYSTNYMSAYGGNYVNNGYYNNGYYSNGLYYNNGYINNGYYNNGYYNNGYYNTGMYSGAIGINGLLNTSAGITSAFSF
jgi:hypothetical protein